MSEDGDFKVARALGMSQGSLDVIIIIAESVVEHLDHIESFKQRMEEIAAHARTSLGNIAKLLPEARDSRDEYLVELTCGHFVQRYSDHARFATSTYPCNVCHRTIKALPDDGV